MNQSQAVCSSFGTSKKCLKFTFVTHTSLEPLGAVSPRPKETQEFWSANNVVFSYFERCGQSRKTKRYNCHTTSKIILPPLLVWIKLNAAQASQKQNTCSFCIFSRMIDVQFNPRKLFIYNKIKKYDQNCRHETKIKQKCRFYKHQQFLKFTVDGRNRANKTNTLPAKINEKTKTVQNHSAQRHSSLSVLNATARQAVLYCCCWPMQPQKCTKADQKTHHITLNEHANGHPGETKT